jgi:hypothetical protein
MEKRARCASGVPAFSYLPGPIIAAVIVEIATFPENLGGGGAGDAVFEEGD